MCRKASSGPCRRHKRRARRSARRQCRADPAAWEVFQKEAAGEIGWRLRERLLSDGAAPRNEGEKGAMVTFIDESNQVSVPSWVTDLASFRAWADADDFPEEGRIWYLKGEVW